MAGIRPGVRVRGFGGHSFLFMSALVLQITGAFTANSPSLLLGESSVVPRSPPLQALWLLKRREKCIIESNATD